MIRFLQSKLSISFRTRLTRYVHDLYLDKNATFYKVVNLDSRIGASGADQFVRLPVLFNTWGRRSCVDLQVTTDINRFCETLSAL